MLVLERKGFCRPTSTVEPWRLSCQCAKLSRTGFAMDFFHGPPRPTMPGKKLIETVLHPQEADEIKAIQEQVGVNG